MTADLSPKQACPLCGSPVRVVGTNEGTQHYEPSPTGLDRKKWTQLLEEEQASRAGGLDVEALLYAWFAALKEDDPDGDLHHAGCLPPEGDCPVAIQLAEFVPKVAAAYREAVKGAGKP